MTLETWRDWLIIAWLAHSLVFQTWALARQAYIDSANQAINQAQQRSEQLQRELAAERAKVKQP